MVNAPTSPQSISQIYNRIDIPIISTVVSEFDNYDAKLDAGVRILNISGGARTPELVRKIRDQYGEELPIIATGGPTDKSILETIEAGANAITYTPPSSGEIFAGVMDNYRTDKEKDR